MNPTPTGCICGGTNSCPVCTQQDRERQVERHRDNVVSTARWCRRMGMALPSELRNALDYLEIAERIARGGR